MAIALADKPKSEVVAQVQRLKNGLANMREAAAVALRRFTIVGIAAPTAWGIGRMEGWAQRTGKNLNIPKTNIRISLAGGLLAVVAGAAGSKLLGDTLADATLGLGGGAIDGTVAVMGYKAGLAPPVVAP